MDKDKLSQLFFLDREIELLRSQINRLEPEFVSDAVKASTAEFPYTSHSVVIKGYAYGEYEARLDRLENKLNKRVNDLVKLRDEISDYIAEIPDSEMRVIMSLRYIEGKTWQEVAEDIGCENESSPRKKHDRYLKMTEISDSKSVNM